METIFFLRPRIYKTSANLRWEPFLVWKVTVPILVHYTSRHLQTLCSARGPSPLSHWRDLYSPSYGTRHHCLKTTYIPLQCWPCMQWGKIKLELWSQCFTRCNYRLLLACLLLWTIRSIVSMFVIMKTSDLGQVSLPLFSLGFISLGFISFSDQCKIFFFVFSGGPVSGASPYLFYY